MKNEYRLTNYEMALEVLEQNGQVYSGNNHAYIPHYQRRVVAI